MPKEKKEEITEPLKAVEPEEIIIPEPEKTKTSNLEDDLGILTGSGYTSRARVTLSSNQTNIVTSTYTQVDLDTEQYDGDGEFNTTTNKFTAASAGYYLVVGKIYWKATTQDKAYSACIYVNGAKYQQTKAQTSLADLLMVQVVDIIYLAATDYVELYAHHEQGSNQDIESAGGITSLAIHRLS